MAYSCLGSVTNVTFAQMCTGASNDYQKDKQFKKLNAQKDKLEVKVIRDGEQILVENTEVVVGDLLLLDTGDKIVADGIVAKSFHLVVDEAALTGESEPLPKGEDDMWCMSGSEVTAHLHLRRYCTWSSPAQRSPAQPNTAQPQHSTAQHSTAQHNTAQHSTARRGIAWLGKHAQQFDMQNRLQTDFAM